MRSARSKLAVLGALAVVVAMVAAAAAFNLFIGWKVESDAVNAIEYLLSLDDNATYTGLTPNYYLVDSSYGVENADSQLDVGVEKPLAAWFAEHPQTGVVNRITLGDWTGYAAIVPAYDYAVYYEDAHHDEGYIGDTGGYRDWRMDDARESGYYIAYIDIASEQELIASVNAAFAIIGLVGAMAAAVAGYVAGRRIEEAQEAQKRFYENMSHDLKTPLAAIRGYAEGASGGVVDAAEATQAIVRETDRMTETINEILGLSRLEAGAVQLCKTLVVVEDFVQDCLMPLEGAVRAKGIDVSLDLAAGEVMADEGMFDHALSNVLTNAVRHAGARVSVTYDGMRLSVWNDGGAPDESSVSRLFDRFHAGKGGSTGIGLAIAKEVAELHGWRISARALNDGLEITFTF